MKSKLEYIWLDGYSPTQNMRSKTKVVEDFNGTLKNVLFGLLMEVQQNKLKVILLIVYLKPVAIFPDPARINGYLSND